jgi:hypothetical protein
VALATHRTCALPWPAFWLIRSFVYTHTITKKSSIILYFRFKSCAIFKTTSALLWRMVFSTWRRYLAIGSGTILLPIKLTVGVKM